MTRIAVLAAAGLVLAAPPALADDQVLATSKAHKLQVLAEGGPAWCIPLLRLRMVLEKDSPDIGNPAAQIDIMNRLKMPITTDCKTATGAELVVIEPGKASAVYTASAANGWSFTAAPVTAAAPSEAPKPATQAPASVAASTPASSPAAAPVAAPPPRDLDYYSAMLRAIRDNPALANDEGTIRQWAAYRFESEYRPVQNQEFKVQPILQKAKTDLNETIARSDLTRVATVLRTHFGSYDFNVQHFPLSLDTNRISLHKPCCIRSELPSAFVVKIADLDAIAGLPMDAASAQSFTERRTRYGSVNRTVYVTLAIALDDAGFKSDGWGNAVALGSVTEAVFYADDKLNEVLYRVGPAEFAKWRENKAAAKAAAEQAAAEHEAELRHQRMMAQREHNIRMLSNSSVSVRLANFIADDDLNIYRGLDNLRDARSAALIGGKPVAVNMLIQAEASGRNNVKTAWPGNLEVTVTEGQTELSSSKWYLVRGLFTVPESGTLPPAQIMAQQVYACTQPKCAEAADATVVVDRRLAAFQGGAQ